MSIYVQASLDPALVVSYVAGWTNSYHYFCTVNAQTYYIADSCPMQWEAFAWSEEVHFIPLVGMRLLHRASPSFSLESSGWRIQRLWTPAGKQHLQMLKVLEVSAVEGEFQVICDLPGAEAAPESLSSYHQSLPSELLLSVGFEGLSTAWSSCMGSHLLWLISSTQTFRRPALPVMYGSECL